MDPQSFADCARRATGHDPYPFQAAIAEHGLPVLLRAPTGSGKTLAAILPWLWRRRAHPDPAVRRGTPRWLVVAQPFRTLVEQVEKDVRGWLEELELTDTVGLHVLMGGRVEQKDWTDQPARDAIVIGSVDMLLSRAMNRGYASSRYHWPIDFGIYNNDVHWVFDEVQLMGPSLPTSRQLQAFRSQWGTIGPTSSTWMSATVEPEWLETIDAPSIDSTLQLTDADRSHPALSARLNARRTIRALPEEVAGNAKTLADAAIERHRAGTRTILVVNTVARARDLAKALKTKNLAADVALVHSRFRARERVDATARAVEQPLPAAGRIVVTTQALEAGVDVTSTILITEVAPWTSIVQRAGRCNRDGRAENAQLWWYEPAKSVPYDDDAITGVADTLRDLDGEALTGAELAKVRTVPAALHPVLRKRDLLDLFDTTPALGGEDIDIGPYIRDGDDRDVFVFWRELPEHPPVELRGDDQELCRVSISDARKWIKKVRDRGLRVWHFDPEGATWRSVLPGEVRPGQTLLAPCRAGGYTPETGWDPGNKTRVVPIDVEPDAMNAINDSPTGDERSSDGPGWVPLPVHLADAEHAAQSLLEALAPDLDPGLKAAVVEAAALHDIGKANEVFQDLLYRSAGDMEQPDKEVLWAKSSRVKQARYKKSRRHHRHELVSLLQLFTPEGADVLESDPDLTRYLVAAHHGRVRMGIRPLADDQPLDGRPMALGVADGDLTLPVELSNGRHFPGVQVDLQSRVTLGAGNWTETAHSVLSREDLGPFRLAWLEAVVRLSDWAASQNPSAVVQQPREAPL